MTRLPALLFHPAKASGFCAGADLGEMNESAGSGGKPESEMSEAELKAQAVRTRILR